MTPAPWLLEDNGYPLEVWGADGAEVCRIGGSPDCPEDDATNQANARLIVAAPDLLAAVRECLVILSQIHVSSPERAAKLQALLDSHTALLDRIEGR